MNLDLAAEVHEKGPVGVTLDLHPRQSSYRIHDPLAMISVHARDGHVTCDLTVVDAHQVNRPEYRSGLADRARHASE
jgi:hypothetical protein